MQFMYFIGFPFLGGTDVSATEISSALYSVVTVKPSTCLRQELSVCDCGIFFPTPLPLVAIATTHSRGG